MHALSKVTGHRRTKTQTKDISTPFGFVHLNHETPRSSALLLTKSAAAAVQSTESESYLQDDGDTDIHSITSEEERSIIMSSTPSCEVLPQSSSNSSLGSGSTIQDRDLKRMITDIMRTKLEPLHRNLNLLLQGHGGQNCRACHGTEHSKGYSQNDGYDHMYGNFCDEKEVFHITVTESGTLTPGSQNDGQKVLNINNTKLPRQSQHLKVPHVHNDMPPLPKPHTKVPQVNNDMPPLPTPYTKVPKGNNYVTPLMSQQLKVPWVNDAMPHLMPYLKAQLTPTQSPNHSPRISPIPEHFGEANMVQVEARGSDDRESLAHALQSHIEELLQSDIPCSDVLEHMFNTSLITPDEYQTIQVLCGRNQQLRTLLSLIKGRDLDVLLAFMKLLEKHCLDLFAKIKKSFEKNKAEHVRSHICVTCHMCQSVNIKYTVDMLWGLHIIPDGLYNEVIAMTMPIGAQDNYWERLLDVLNSGSHASCERSVKALISNLRDKNHYRHVAERLEEHWEKGSYRLLCTCMSQKGTHSLDSTPTDSTFDRLAFETTSSRQSTVSLVYDEGIAEELETRLHEIEREHESRGRLHPALPPRKK